MKVNATTVVAEARKRIGRPPNPLKAAKVRRTTVPVDELARMRSDLESNERTIAYQRAEITKLHLAIEKLESSLEAERNKPAPHADPYGEWAKRSVPELIELLRASGF